MLKFTEKNSSIQKDLTRAHQEKNNGKDFSIREDIAWAQQKKTIQITSAEVYHPWQDGRIRIRLDL